LGFSAACQARSVPLKKRRLEFSDAARHRLLAGAWRKVLVFCRLDPAQYQCVVVGARPMADWLMP
jgi:hypothetical protein